MISCAPPPLKTANPPLTKPNQSFNHLAKHPGVDLYPPHLREAIDAANEWIYPSINNGVYRCGAGRARGSLEDGVGCE